eukprot:244227_1
MGNKLHKHRHNEADKQSNHSNNIVNQLKVFGYETNDIQMALDNLPNNPDIGRVIDHIEYHKKQTAPHSNSASKTMKTQFQSNSPTLDGIPTRASIRETHPHLMGHRMSSSPAPRYRTDHNKSSAISTANPTRLLQYLVEMGFDQQLSKFILPCCGYHLEASISLLSNDSFTNNLTQVLRASMMDQGRLVCTKHIGTCMYLVALHTQFQIIETLDEYNIESDTDITGLAVLPVDMLNHFQHLMIYHDSDDDFEHIHNTLGGNCDQQTGRCIVIDRVLTSKRMSLAQMQKKSTNTHTFHAKEICDVIHCHFRHGYDMGLRLNRDERAAISDCKNNEDEKSNTRIHILNNKKMMRDIHHTKATPWNKYCTNLGQTKTLAKYSYSFEWHYNSKFKGWFSGAGRGRLIGDLYVTNKKHASLREELLDSTIYRIGKEQFDHVMERAAYQKMSTQGRKCRAHFLSSNPNLPAHPSNSAYANGEPIAKEHLFVVIVYCCDDAFQYAFTQTYRATKKSDTFVTIRDNHSHFHYFAKLLKEAVQCFGTRYVDTPKPIYHGVNQEMYFDDLNPCIYSPLSTTCVPEVAMYFASQSGNDITESKGMIVELIPQASLKYFRCNWLSNYSHEKELLFVGGWGSNCIVNLTFISTGTQLYDNIAALRIIDAMTKDHYYLYDPTKWYRESQPLQLNHIPNDVVNLCVGLIHHELNKNTFEPDTYRKLKGLDPYVERMAHEIFSSKEHVIINWDKMEEDINTECGQWGYGYKFLRSLFCAEDYEGIRLDLVHALFPQLKNLVVMRLWTIDSMFLDSIIKTLVRLREKKCTISITLYIKTQLEYSNITAQLNKYERKFQQIDYFIGHEETTFTNGVYPEVKGIIIHNNTDWENMLKSSLVNSQFDREIIENTAVYDVFGIETPFSK